VDLPGDKSISHRAFLLNVLGEGEAAVGGANPGLDLASTRRVLKAVGVSIVELEDGSYRVRGRKGRLRPATDALDCGNSGTTLRLLAGLLAAQPFTTTLVGDASLLGRPMLRIAAPLREMGAGIDGPSSGATPPLIVTGGRLEGRRFELEIASAQVKSCLLLAAAAAGVAVEVTEPYPSRDHTERMLEAMGGAVEHGPGWVRWKGEAPLRCVDVEVPGDPSAGALLAAAACSVPGSRIELRNMSLNPTRSSFLAILERMGVQVDRGGRRTSAGEDRGDVMISAPSTLRPVTVEEGEIPGLIDEIPALAALCAFAPGVSRFAGVRELRVKESDRVAAVVELLHAFGVEAEGSGDQLVVHGGKPHPVRHLEPAKDHRMVMSAAALAVGVLHRHGGSIGLEGEEDVAVSFPGFFEILEKLGQGA